MRLNSSAMYQLVLPIITGLISILTFETNAEDEIQFNTSILDVADENNLDLSQFSKKGFILPGTYPLMMQINGQSTEEFDVVFRAPQTDPDGSEACLTEDMVAMFGLKPELLDELKWDKTGQCLDPDSLSGLTIEASLATSSMSVGIPQMYLEYSDANWDPPSRWDHGISGVMVDYYINVQSIDRQHDSRGSENTMSGNGTTGVNLGAWRFRADWQLTPDSSSSPSSMTTDLEWSRYYAYRPLPALAAKLTIGEDYLNSEIFDSFRFTGAGLKSDSNMLPPHLRGYAPEVTGVANSNARVTISQQGRVLYETQVASGPFSIQNISDAVSGTLDVKISEADGTVREFQVNTADVPYLTRPGTVRYSAAAGRASSWTHSVNGPLFATGEFSWGVSNGWSLFGGGIASDNYQAVSAGIGRDMFVLGALSFDITQSSASLPDDSTLKGKSFRLDYSKFFDDLDANVSFAGYRFSEEEFMSMDEYLGVLNMEERSGSRKEMYTLTLNKRFDSLAMSAYLNYSHETYWDKPDRDRLSLTASQNFDLGPIKNLNVSLSAYRNEYEKEKDDGIYLSLSVPFGNGGTVSYNMSNNGSNTEQSASYYKRVNENTNYQVSTGYSDKNKSVSANVMHATDVARVNGNMSYHSDAYTQLGISLQGGGTATMKGVALHRSGMPGGTRLMVDTDDVPDVPVRGYGATVFSNRFGTSVLSDVNSYYRNSAKIDLEKLNDNTEVRRSVAEVTLTEGAIGYRHFDVISGNKSMVVIRLEDGSHPPFGATVQNKNKQEIGLVNDGGSVYLSGINPGEKMSVLWDGDTQCEIELPDMLPEGNEASANLLLMCRAGTASAMNMR